MATDPVSDSTRISVVPKPYQDESCCSLACCNTTINKFCCKLYKDRNDIEAMLDNVDISVIQKQHIQTRYINILENLKKRSQKYSIVFFVGHFIITVGSLFVPALLSLQNSTQSLILPNGGNISVNMITFIVSLLVTIFNGILTLFKIDKKYYFLTTTMEKLRSEGWQYLGLTGRYSGHLNNMAPTHTNQFLYFAHQIERIKMKQVEAEFYKSDEAPATDVRSNGTKQNDLYPPSLMAPIIDTHIPDPIKDVVQSIIKTQNDSVKPLAISSLDSLAITIEEPKNKVIVPFETSYSTTSDPVTPNLLYKGPVAIPDPSDQ